MILKIKFRHKHLILSFKHIQGRGIAFTHSITTLTFDLEDHICFLFLVVDYVVVHLKLNPP